MAIDKSGESWRGANSEDIAGYLEELEPGGYEVTSVRKSQCACGETAFRLAIDFDEELARKTCASCGESRFIADSEKYWSEAHPEKLFCRCGGQVFDVAISLSERRAVGFGTEKPWVRWMAVGVRCTACGVLGSPLDWKCDYALDDPALESL